jgi:hypothetical protein
MGEGLGLYDRCLDSVEAFSPAEKPLDSGARTNGSQSTPAATRSIASVTALTTNGCVMEAATRRRHEATKGGLVRGVGPGRAFARGHRP